jgi:hypothetical protein
MKTDPPPPITRCVLAPIYYKPSKDGPDNCRICVYNNPDDPTDASHCPENNGIRLCTPSGLDDTDGITWVWIEATPEGLATLVADRLEHPL